jgi:hypothetical protein
VITVFWAPGAALLLALPLALVFAHYAVTGRSARWVMAVGIGCGAAYFTAGFLDNDACVDAGGRYLRPLGCIGAEPERGLILQGGGTVGIRAVVFAIAAAATGLFWWAPRLVDTSDRSKHAG